MIKSPAKKQGILYLSDGRNLAASAFRCYPAPAARMVGGFASSCEAKSASTSEASSSSHSERAASAFRYYPASAARISGHFALSHEAKSASRSRA